MAAAYGVLHGLAADSRATITPTAVDIVARAQGRDEI